MVRRIRPGKFGASLGCIAFRLYAGSGSVIREAIAKSGLVKVRVLMVVQRPGEAAPTYPSVVLLVRLGNGFGEFVRSSQHRWSHSSP